MPCLVMNMTFQTADPGMSAKFHRTNARKSPARAQNERDEASSAAGKETWDNFARIWRDSWIAFNCAGTTYPLAVIAWSYMPTGPHSFSCLSMNMNTVLSTPLRTWGSGSKWPPTEWQTPPQPCIDRQPIWTSIPKTALVPSCRPIIHST